MEIFMDIHIDTGGRCQKPLFLLLGTGAGTAISVSGIYGGLHIKIDLSQFGGQPNLLASKD